jgi:hypothetical protein
MLSGLNTVPQCFDFGLSKRIRAWLSVSENIFFAALIIIHLLPIWAFQYFPSQDGPCHLNNANIVREYNNPELPVFRQYHTFNKNLDPNWLGHLVLAGLMCVFPMLVAEKILLSGYVLLLPLSIRYALRAIRPDVGFLAFLAFPFIYNYLFHMGFYNFSYSLPMFFFVIGFWLKYRDRFMLRETVTLSFLSLLLYYCHIVSLVMAYVGIAILAIWLTIHEVVRQTRERRYDLRALWNGFRTRALVPLYSFLPSLILVSMFLLRSGTQRSFPPPARILWNRLTTLSSLASFDREELWFSTAFVCLFIAIFIYVLVSKVVQRRVNYWDGLLIVFAAYLILYFIMPEHMSGGGFLNYRLSFYPYLCLDPLVWSAAVS